MSLAPVPAGATPGSVAAVKLGCSCPLDENEGGAGRREILHSWLPDEAKISPSLCFVVKRDCPVHGAPEWKPESSKKHGRPSQRRQKADPR